MSDYDIKFGDPVSVTNQNLLEFLGTFPSHDNVYYIPPVQFAGLSKMKDANGQHSSCLVSRNNFLTNSYNSGPLSATDFSSLAEDFLIFGNAFLALNFNGWGEIVKAKHFPAINMRVGVDGKSFYRLEPEGKQPTRIANKFIIHIKRYSSYQQIYGMPDWLGSIQSVLLNEDATIFRRKYFVNGAHLGYIMYSRDSKMPPELRKKFSEQIKAGKGAGNFKSIFLHIPNGDPDAIKILPIGDISQRDEFLNIKNVSRDDILIAHRMPAILMGIAPQGTGSLGDPEKLEKIYIRNETRALARFFSDLNDQLPNKLQFNFNFKVKEE